MATPCQHLDAEGMEILRGDVALVHHSARALGGQAASIHGDGGVHERRAGGQRRDLVGDGDGGNSGQAAQSVLEAADEGVALLAGAEVVLAEHGGGGDGAIRAYAELDIAEFAQGVDQQSGGALVALAYRAGRERFVEASLAILVLVYGCRTWMRNPQWTSELTLASADVRTVPGSFKIHEMLAHALSVENAKANIDEVIRHQEIAWRILRPVPANLGYQQAPANLGGYYIAKGDMLGGAATSEGRAWYEKAVAVLSEGEAMSRAVERHYDDEQRAHGKPLEGRAAMPNLYLNLGAAYAELGRNAEAIRAFRYGRNVEPKVAEVYDGLAGAYLADGKPVWAAISMVEKALMDGAQPATLSGLRSIYARIPDGACGVAESGGTLKFNLECPRLRSDLCSAWLDLSQAFAEARQPAASGEFKQRAAAFGCR